MVAFFETMRSYYGYFKDRDLINTANQWESHSSKTWEQRPTTRKPLV